MRVLRRAAMQLAGTRRLAALLLLVAVAGGPVAPAAAQDGALHFGRIAGEDRLVGGARAPAGSTGPGLVEPWHRSQAARAAYRYASPSVVSYPRPSGSTYYRGTGIFANAQGTGSVLVLPPRERADRGPAGAKIIDVAAHRLDRRPIGPSGLSVQYVGSAKIIRIAPGYGRPAAARADGTPEDRPAAEKDMAALPAPAEPVAPVPTPAPAQDRPAAVEPVPAETPSSEDAPAEAAAPVLEPWTDEWLRDCVDRHEDFDAALGTYTGEDGRRRFCTGEAG